MANDRAGRREWIGLAVLALPSLLVSIDVFVMLLALPHISDALHASSAQQLWIMDSYGFLLSGFLITMGTLGDRVGRRKLLLIGAGAFAVLSMVAAWSTSPGMLIVARGALGVAGATLAPSTLALISHMFRDTAQRGVAIGLWFACFMGGALIGPMVGGVLLARFWWGSVLLLGVPAMVLLLILGPFLLPEHRSAAPGRLDPASVLASLAAVLAFVYGVKQLAAGGAPVTSVLFVVAALVVGVLFVRRQLTLTDPLLDVRLFRDRRLSTALGTMFTGTMLTGALMMFITEYLELVRGRSALGAAFAMTPVVAASLVSFMVSPLLARRARPADLIGGGLLVSVAGLLVIIGAGPASPTWVVVAGWAVMNLGAGPFVALGTNLVVSSAPADRAGSAAALNETSGELGYALGIAALGSVGTLVYRSEIAGAAAGLPAPARETAGDTLAGAVSVARTLSPAARDDLLDAARASFTNGMHAAATISAVALAALALLVVTVLRRSPTPTTEAPVKVGVH